MKENNVKKSSYVCKVIVCEIPNLDRARVGKHKSVGPSSLIVRSYRPDDYNGRKVVSLF